MDRKDLVSLTQKVTVNGFEIGGGGLGSRREPAPGSQSPIEVIGGKVDAILVADVVQDHVGREDGHIPPLLQISRQVRGVVGYDPYCHGFPTLSAWLVIWVLKAGLRRPASAAGDYSNEAR